MQTRTIEVDSKTYKKMKQDAKNRPYSIEKMILYDRSLMNGMISFYASSLEG